MAQLMLLAIAFAVVAMLEGDPLKTGKKKLALTARAGRILGLALVLSLAVAALVAWLVPSVLGWLIPVHVVPLSLAGATVLLAPSERRVQAKYWREAEAVLQRIKPTVVGITGSYGKTSTKHLLAHILSVQAPTLATPGSVNTAMGIARIVRERLESRHRW